MFLRRQECDAVARSNTIDHWLFAADSVVFLPSDKALKRWWKFPAVVLQGFGRHGIFNSLLSLDGGYFFDFRAHTAVQDDFADVVEPLDVLVG